MRRRLRQSFAPMVGAVFLTLGLGLATGLRREPANTPFVLKSDPGATEAAFKRAPADPSVAVGGWLTEIVPAKPRLNIRCRTSLASCRRWIALQERNGWLVVHSAQR
ncbi:MAG: hypothetical protein J2P50_10930 [Hyphomicrobiaceae bacterium]|nr:hypothetical protein [Hyphomicrobiaceae bacterium]